MGRADLHIHTRVSDGFATVEQVIAHCEEIGTLDVIAVADHEDATGGLRARELAAKRGSRLGVVPGAEVTTLQGHVLALFVERCPRSFRSVERTLEAIHAQGGIAIVPHPMSWLTRSVSRRTIDRLHSRNEVGITFDGIETANPSPAGRATAGKTQRLNRAWGLSEVGGSDAHHLAHIGSGWTAFEGTSPEELRREIQAGRTRGAAGVYPSIRDVGVGRTIMGLAWGYAATPRKMLRLRKPTGRDE